MLENFQGDSWGSIPPLCMSSLLPHDLCHGWSASRWATTLKDICFTEFCGFLSYVNKNWPLVHPCPLPPKPLFCLPPHPILLGCHKALVWVPWVIQQTPIGDLFYQLYYKFPCYSLHTSNHSLLPSPHVLRAVLCTSKSNFRTRLSRCFMIWYLPIYLALFFAMC